MTNTNSVRKFTTCPKCSSATLSNFIQASGLCKVCDSYRLREVVYVPMEREGSAHVDQDHGQPNDLKFDYELGHFYTLDDDNNRVIVEEQMCSDDNIAARKRSRKLEAAADAFLAKAEKAEALKLQEQELHQKILDLGANDPKQFLLNKARLAAGLKLCLPTDKFHPATPGQKNALDRLGCEDLIVSHAMLSFNEASMIIKRIIASFNNK